MCEFSFKGVLVLRKIFWTVLLSHCHRLILHAVVAFAIMGLLIS